MAGRPAQTSSVSTIHKSVALLLEDALRFAIEDGVPGNRDWQPFMVGLAMLRQNTITNEQERNLFSLFLDAGWRTTAYFERSVFPFPTEKTQ